MLARVLKFVVTMVMVNLALIGQAKVDLGAKDLDSGNQSVFRVWVWPDRHETNIFFTMLEICSGNASTLESHSNLNSNSFHPDAMFANACSSSLCIVS